MKRNWQALLGIVAIAAAPIVPLLFRPESLLVWPGADVSDLVTAHLPASEFINYSLAQWGQLPLWNPSILSGMPTLGDPLTGIAYFPIWLTYLLPTSGAYHLLFWLHLSWAGIGVYQLAKLRGLDPFAAWLAGVSVTLSPRVLGQWGLGHATLVFAFCWTPWVIYSFQRGLIQLKEQETIAWRWFTLAGGLMGLSVMADPRWALPVGLLVSAYWLVQLSEMKLWKKWPQIFQVAFGSGLILFGSASFLIFPMMDLVAGSLRAGLNGAVLQGQALPPSALIGIVVPNPAIWPEWSTTIGATVFILAVLSLFRYRRSLFWWGILLLGILLSLGPATPLWGSLQRWVPGFNLMRMPGRWFLLASFASALLAASGFQTIIKARDDNIKRNINLTMVATAGLVVLLSAARLIALGEPTSPAGVVAVSTIVLVMIVIILVVTGRLTPKPMIALVVAELLMLGFTTFQVREIDDSLPTVFESFHKADVGGSRLLSTTFELNQMQAARGHLELANGVHPLLLENYWIFMANALGYNSEQYSVTLPPFPTNDDVRFSIQPAELMMLNVSHILSEGPLEDTELKEIASADGFWLYEFEQTRPRAWLERNQAAGDNNWAEVERIGWTPNQITISANGPGKLVLSEVYHPRWRVRVDGESREVIAHQGVLSEVDLASGVHEVIFSVGAGNAWIGLTISLMSWLLIGYLAWKR